MWLITHKSNKNKNWTRTSKSLTGKTTGGETWDMKTQGRLTDNPTTNTRKLTQYIHMRVTRKVETHGNAIGMNRHNDTGEAILNTK